jgi:hypothetical protein
VWMRCSTNLGESDLIRIRCHLCFNQFLSWRTRCLISAGCLNSHTELLSYKLARCFKPVFCKQRHDFEHWPSGDIP